MIVIGFNHHCHRLFNRRNHSRAQRGIFYEEGL
jgi:hypothetical protein